MVTGLERPELTARDLDVCCEAWKLDNRRPDVIMTTVPVKIEPEDKIEGPSEKRLKPTAPVNIAMYQGPPFTRSDLEPAVLLTQKGELPMSIVK